MLCFLTTVVTPTNNFELVKGRAVMLCKRAIHVPQESNKMDVEISCTIPKILLCCMVDLCLTSPQKDSGFKPKMLFLSDSGLSATSQNFPIG